jgi:hypothetical protein
MNSYKNIYLHKEIMLDLENIHGFATCIYDVWWLGCVISTNETTEEMKVCFLTIMVLHRIFFSPNILLIH